MALLPRTPERRALVWHLRECVRAAKEMDSKSIGLCPQGFESPRCRNSFSPKTLGVLPGNGESPSASLLAAETAILRRGQCSLCPKAGAPTFALPRDARQCKLAASAPQGITIGASDIFFPAQEAKDGVAATNSPAPRARVTLKTVCPSG